MRLLKNWLDTYNIVGSKLNASKLLFEWVGVSLLAAALKRQVYINRGLYFLYPNFYIVLVGKSGIGKSTVADWGFDEIIKNIPSIKSFSGRSTTEFIIDVLGEYTTSQEKNVLITEPSLYLYSSELSSLLKPGPKGLMSLMDFLTDVYNRGSYDKGTKSDGRQQLENISMNLLGCTTPEGVREIFGRTAIEGGIAGRIIFVNEDNGYDKAWSTSNLEVCELRSQLINDLLHISKLRGEFYVSTEVRRWFTDWFDQHKKFKATPELSHYQSRRPDILLKLGMVLSISESDKLELKLEYLEKAKKILLHVEKFMLSAMINVERNKYSFLRELVVEFLQQQPNKSVTRWQLSRRLQHRLGSSRELDMLIDYLKECNILREESSLNTKRRDYLLMTTTED